MNSPSPNPSLKRSNTDLSLYPFKPFYATYHCKSPENSIPVLMLESYLSNICKTISVHKSITSHSYDQVVPLRKVLQDCMAVSNISLNFYSKVNSALDLIATIHESNTSDLVINLVQSLANICEMISKGEHFAYGISIPIRKNSPKTREECLIDLNTRINRVTPRVVNILRNIILGVKELEIVAYGFLKLYCEVDQFVPKPGFCDPVQAMMRYCRNPGHLVQVIRKTQVYIEKEAICVKTAREVFALVQKTPPEVLTCVDKTLSGFILWDLVRTALEYFRTVWFEEYATDVFEKQELAEGKMTNEKGLINKEIEDNDLKVGRNGLLKSLDKRLDVSLVRGRDLENDRYDCYITELFQMFLRSKLLKGRDLNRQEILAEFTEIILIIDKETISGLWSEKNLLKTGLI